MSADIKAVHEELLRTNEEFKHEVKKNGDNVDRIAKGLLDLESQIKDIKTSIVETKVTDRVMEGKERSKEEKQFWGFMKGDVTEQEYKQYVKSTQGVVSTPADGGYAVPTVLDQNITALLLEFSDMRSVAKKVTIGGSTGYIHTISQSNAAIAWGGETAPTGTSNAPTLGQVTIVPQTLNAAPEVSSQMIEDVFFDAEAWFIAEVVKQIAIAEGTAFINGLGAGSNQPTGLLTYATNSLGTTSSAGALSLTGNAPSYTSLNTITAANASAIGFYDIYNLPYALKPLYRKGGTYAMNRAILSQIMTLKSSTGQPLWQPSMIAGQPSLLNGYPVVEMPDMPSVLSTTSGTPTLAITFGDFGVGYTVVDRIGTTVQRNPFVNFPFVRFQTRKRVGGGLEDGNALVTLNVLG
jgi:HK97 family phage major capsid protein